AYWRKSPAPLSLRLQNRSRRARFSMRWRQPIPCCVVRSEIWRPKSGDPSSAFLPVERISLTSQRTPQYRAKSQREYSRFASLARWQAGKPERVSNRNGAQFERHFQFTVGLQRIQFPELLVKERFYGKAERTEQYSSR